MLKGLVVRIFLNKRKQCKVAQYFNQFFNSFSHILRHLSQVPQNASFTSIFSATNWQGAVPSHRARYMNHAAYNGITYNDISSYVLVLRSRMKAGSYHMLTSIFDENTKNVHLNKI